jgi:hypothetical protein
MMNGKMGLESAVAPGIQAGKLRMKIAKVLLLILIISPKFNRESDETMNLYRVRKTWHGRCILQAYHKAEDRRYSRWFDVPYAKAPTQLREVWEEEDYSPNNTGNKND